MSKNRRNVAIWILAASLMVTVGPWTAAAAKAPKIKKAITKPAAVIYLDSLVGRWSGVSKTWISGKEIVEKQQLIAARLPGEKILETKLTGVLAGFAIDITNRTHYDPVKKQLITTWLDQMAKGPELTEGSFDRDKGIREETGTWKDTVMGGTTRVRFIYRHLDKDRFIMELYQSGAVYGDNEVKTLEITFTRENRPD